MDAFLSRSGIIDARTDIAKAEVYLLAEPGTELTEKQVRTLVENDYGYGLRSYETTTDKNWEEIGGDEE